MVVLKQFQNNLFHLLRSLVRISWDIGVPGLFLLISIKNYISDNFLTFKTQNTEYNYICVENYIYKKLQEAVEIYKNQRKSHSVLAKIYNAYIICTPKCDAFGNNFFPFLSINECYKPNR